MFFQFQITEIFFYGIPLKSSSLSHPSGNKLLNNSVKILFKAKIGPPNRQIIKITIYLPLEIY